MTEIASHTEIPIEPLPPVQENKVEVKPFYFCPKCKRKIVAPNYKMLSGGQIKFLTMNIACGHAERTSKKYPMGIRCAGKVTLIGDQEQYKFMKEYQRNNKMSNQEMNEFLEKNKMVKTVDGWKMEEIKKAEPKTEENVSSES